MIAVCGRRLSKQQQPLSTLFLRQKGTRVRQTKLNLFSHSYSKLGRIIFDTFND